MNEKNAQLADKIIWILYLALAIVTPLLFTTQTTELFEVPKMYFVYSLATVILFLTITKFVISSKITIPLNPIAIALTIFVVVQILSTIFSIDKFISIFGFPSRLNGGLLSQFAYFSLFICALINWKASHARKLVLAILATSTAIALWGILGHFDKDPTCFVLTNQLSSSCWQEDFDPKVRIFSTLGQPNWLASYLVLIIPLSLAFFLTFKKPRAKLFFAGSLILFFLALIFTGSRAGIFGFAISLAVFFLLSGREVFFKNSKYFLASLLALILIASILGKTLTNRLQETINNSSKKEQSGQLETPTDSSKIRLIVWIGTWEIFKKWPILGSGPETFVDSYFLVRSKNHNRTSEWEFFYNKAHNEFLNYLANSGIVGFSSYILFLLTTATTLYKISAGNVIAKAALAAFLGYLATIFFGFSTVATQTTFFLIIAATVLQTTKNKVFRLNLGKAWQIAVFFAITLLALISLSFITKLYISDYFEKRAQSQDQSWQAEINSYQRAVNISPVTNPYLLANFSGALAQAALSAKDKNVSDQFFNKADFYAKQALTTSPINYLIVQRAAKTYIFLASENSDVGNKAQLAGEKLILLAPTYPPAYLTNAKLQIILENNEKAKEYLEKTLELKPDYLEARQLLDQLQEKQLQ